MVKINVNVWTASNVALRSKAIDAVTDALDDCFEQLNRTSVLNIQDKGVLEGSWNDADTYKEYSDKFTSKISRVNGTAHCLVYDRGLIQGNLLKDGLHPTETAAAGYSWGPLRSNTTARFVLNGDVLNYDRHIFENFVKHEFLHLVLEDSEAKVPGDDHSDGTQYHEKGGWNDLNPTESSPMLTGYTEEIIGDNEDEKPAKCCGQDSVNFAEFHSGSLSSCTKRLARDWIDNKY